jgi:hypothetical protein
MERPADFKRMMLSLPHSSGDYAAVAFTAELAALLGIDLLGIFAMDENLARLASLPCVRELRPSGGWHPINAAEIEQDSSRAIAEARHRFAEAVKARRSDARFDVAKASIADIIGAQSTPQDIVVVVQPRNPAERVTHQFMQLLDAAFAAPSATLLIPTRVIRRRGPVVAIATHEDDTSIRTALQLAERSHERLLLLVPPGADEVPLDRLASAARVPIDWRRLPEGDIDASRLDILLAPTGERLLVLSRGTDAGVSTQLAFERAIPVLVTEPTGQMTSSPAQASV